jgi:hypothetical protein
MRARGKAQAAEVSRPAGVAGTVVGRSAARLRSGRRNGVDDDAAFEKDYKTRVDPARNRGLTDRGQPLGWRAVALFDLGHRDAACRHAGAAGSLGAGHLQVLGVRGRRSHPDAGYCYR